MKTIGDSTTRTPLVERLRMREDLRTRLVRLLAATGPRSVPRSLTERMERPSTPQLRIVRSGESRR